MCGTPAGAGSGADVAAFLASVTDLATASVPEPVHPAPSAG